MPYFGLIVASVLCPATTLEAGNKADVTKYLAESGEHVTAVEEHWKVRVKFPDPNRGLPEFLFVLSPTGHFDSQHVVLALNHQLHPGFSKGGVQLLAYHGEKLTGFQSRLNNKLLWETDDDIEIEVRMEIVDSKINYEVLKLKGKTWGDNKETGWCRLSESTSQKHFDNYDAAITHKFTGCANGVHTLEKVEVTKVRYEFSDGKTFDVDDYKTKIEYEPSIVYRSYDEYKASLEAYKE